MSIGRQIKKYRNNLHITQRELADKLYVTQQAVQRWESGNSCPQADKMIEIAEVFDVSVSDLYFGDDQVVMRYVVIDVTGLIRSFIDRVRDYLKYNVLSDICGYIFECIDVDSDENGRILRSVGFDRIQYSAYVSLKNHCNIDDIDFWKCVNRSDFDYFNSGQFYFDTAFEKYQTAYHAGQELYFDWLKVFVG